MQRQRPARPGRAAPPTAARPGPAAPPGRAGPADAPAPPPPAPCPALPRPGRAGTTRPAAGRPGPATAPRRLPGVSACGRGPAGPARGRARRASFTASARPGRTPPCPAATSMPGPGQPHPVFGHRQQQVHRPGQRRLLHRDVGDAVQQRQPGPRCGPPTPCRPATRPRCCTGPTPPRPPRRRRRGSPARRSSPAPPRRRSSGPAAPRHRGSCPPPTHPAASRNRYVRRDHPAPHAPSPSPCARSAIWSVAASGPAAAGKPHPHESVPPGHAADPPARPPRRTAPRRPADPPGPRRSRRRRRCHPAHARRSPARPAPPGNTSPPGSPSLSSTRPRYPGTRPIRDPRPGGHGDPGPRPGTQRFRRGRRGGARCGPGSDVIAEGDLQAGLPGDPGHDHPAGGGELQPELHLHPVRPRRRPRLSRSSAAVDLATSMIASCARPNASSTFPAASPGRTRGRLGPGHRDRLDLDLGVPDPDRDQPAASHPTPPHPTRNGYPAPGQASTPWSTTIAPFVPLRHRLTALFRTMRNPGGSGRLPPRSACAMLRSAGVTCWPGRASLARVRRERCARPGRPERPRADRENARSDN